MAAAAPAPVSWVKGYRQASFRGVTFSVLTIGNSGGRRNVEHTFPQRDDGYTEDMGRRQRHFRVEGHVIGDDFTAQWAKVLTALESGGPGTLVHPYYGNYTVNVDTIEYANPPDGGRIQSFSVTFIESGQALYPQTAVDPRTSVEQPSTNAKGSIASRFAKAFSVLGQPAFVVAAATAMVGKVGGVMSSIISPLSGDVGAVATFSTSVQALSTQATALVQLPSSLAASIQNSISQIAGVFGNNASTVAALLGLAAIDSDFDTVPTPTAARMVQASNQAQMVALVQVSAVSEAGLCAINALLEGGFVSADDADASRDAVADAIDTLMGSGIDDATYNNLQTLRSQLYANIPAAGQQLPSIVQYEPPTVLPILVIEYDLYGDDSLEADIISRNGIVYPGFVPPNPVLKVLSSG